MYRERASNYKSIYVCCIQYIQYVCIYICIYITARQRRSHQRYLSMCRPMQIYIVSIDRPMCLYIVCVYIHTSRRARDTAISVIYLCIDLCRYKIISVDRPMSLYIVYMYVYIYIYISQPLVLFIQVQTYVDIHSIYREPFFVTHVNPNYVRQLIRMLRKHAEPTLYAQ